jgi:PAS domain S-box-containing protein
MRFVRVKKISALLQILIHDGILIALPSGFHCYANQHFSEITGYSLKELHNLNMQQLAHPDEIPKLTERLKKFPMRLFPIRIEPGFLQRADYQFKFCVVWRRGWD